MAGNIRDLQNVIERAVITVRDGRLNLDRALPATPARRGCSQRKTWLASYATNLRRALERTDWQVAGESGAARLLGVAPSTLAPRM